MRLLTRSALLGAVSSVQAFTYNTRFENVTWDDDNWRLTTTNLDQGHYESRMMEPFSEVDTRVNGDQINGWPLFDRRQTFATIAGFYDSQPTLNGTNSEWLNQHGWESAISGVPHWSSIAVISPGGQVLNASVPALQISSFISTLDIGAGSMRWSCTWTPQGEPAIDVEYSMFVSKLYVNRAAVQLKLTPSRDMNVTVMDILDGDCAQRTDFVNKSYQANSSTIWTAVRPNGIANVTANVYSTMAGDFNSSTRANVLDPSVIGTNSSSIAQSFNA
ncbi:hypothetical protein B0A49_13654, partial [Cryomyces minteri]